MTCKRWNFFLTLTSVEACWPTYTRELPNILWNRQTDIFTKKDFFTLKHFNYSKAMICSSERPFIFNLSLIITKLTKNPLVQNIREYHWVIKLRRYAIQMKRKFVQITMNNGIWIVHESHGNKSRDTKINLCSKLSFTIQEFMSFVLK